MKMKKDNDAKQVPRHYPHLLDADDARLIADNTVEAT